MEPSPREVAEAYWKAECTRSLEALLEYYHDDATATGPTGPAMRGHGEIAKFYVGQGAACEGSRLLTTSANGCVAFAAYKPAGQGLRLPWAIQVIEVSDGRISGLHHFIYPELFTAFGFPDRLED